MTLLAQSNSFLREIKNYSSIKNNVIFFPSWGEDNLFKKIFHAQEIKKRNIFAILFAGNIGEAQDFPNILKAIKDLKDQGVKDFRILLVGEGSKRLG